MTDPSARPSLTIIEPRRGWVPLDLRELWRYRDLLAFLTWRDVKVRYRQTLLGALWALIQPLGTMVVFSVFFGLLARVPSDGVPYPLFAYAGLLPWMFFANALNQSANSLVGSQNLISKVWFPRLVIPLSATLSGLIDLVIGLAALGLLLVWYGQVPTLAVVALPGFALLALVTSLATGLWLSALNVEYRDVRYTLPFLTQLWMFATPVAYPASLVPPGWRTLYGLNPMVGVVEGFRWALVGTPRPDGGLLSASAVATALLLVGGLVCFKRMERRFADVV